MSKRKEKILGELGFTYAGLSGKTQKDFGRGKSYIPFMNIMSNGKIDPKFMGLVDVAPNERQNVVQKGDLFFTTSSETPEEVGMTSVLLEDVGECYLNSFCFGFRLYNFDDLLPEFAPYLFRGNEVRKQIINLGQGYTRFNLPKTELLKKLRLSIPSENEQKRISEILTKADSIIEKTQAAIAKYKAIKQGMLQDLFTRGIDLNTNKLRPRYEDAPQLYKESKLGMIPREWEVEKIGKIFRFNQGVQCPVELQKLHQGENEVRFIRIIDLTNEGEPPRYIADPGSQYHINSNDLFMVRYGSPGLVGYGYEGVIANNLFRIISTGELEILNSFYRYYLTSINDKLTALSASTTMPAINFDSLNKLHVIYPQIFEQVEIEKRIKAIDKKLQTEQNYLQKMQSLKKGLMEDLLCGKKQVKVAEEVLTQSEN